MRRNQKFLPRARVFTGNSSYHFFVLANDGDLYGIGSNNCGQLGIGDTIPRKKLTKVPIFSSQIVKLALATCGRTHSLFLTTYRELFVCGCNSNGELGLGDMSNRGIPQKVSFFSNLDLIDVAAGIGTSFCLSSNGKVYSFGCNVHGNLGDGTTQNRSVPQLISLPDDVSIIKISAGYEHAAALSSNGTIFTWGRIDYGQLGRGGDIRCPSAITEIKNDFRALQVVCGGLQTTAIYSEYKIVSWGSNDNGNLGVANFNIQPLGRVIEWFDTRTLSRISIGGEHTICCAQNGEWYAFGWNGLFQLCLLDDIDRSKPSKVNKTNVLDLDGNIFDIICGFRFSIIVTDKCGCYGVGDGLAFGLEYDIIAPVRLYGQVDIGNFDRVAENLLARILDEQEMGEVAEGRGGTANFKLYVYDGQSENVLLVDRALLRRRCDISKLFGRLRVPKPFSDTRTQILAYLYTDKVENAVIAREMRDLLYMNGISLKDCVMKLYQAKEEEGDVIITSQEDFVFKAHKFILVARTDYFNSIFHGEWSEARSSSVKLEMPLDSTFEVYLKYLYTGDAEFTDAAFAKKFEEYCDYFGHGRVKSNFYL